MSKKVTPGLQRAGDLMRELGFREDASDSLKRAFIRNLVRAADSSAPLPPVSQTAGRDMRDEPEQLAFDLLFDQTEEPDAAQSA